MSGVRVLVGTRKGAFILTADGERRAWEVSGPHFAGWEIYHVKGSPADPNRLYASQSSGWFGQVIQRSDDGGKTWAAGRQQVRLRRRRRHAPVVRRHAAPVGVQARLAPRAVARPIPTPSTPASRTPRCSARPTAARPGTSSPACAATSTGPDVAAGRRRHVPAHDHARSAPTRAASSSRSRPPARSAPTTAARPGGRSTAACAREWHPRPRRRGRPLRPPHRHAPVAPRTCCSCRSTGTSCAATTPASPGARSAATCRPTSASRSTSTRTSRRRSTSSRSRATPSTSRSTASCASTAAAPAATSGSRSPTGCRSSDCYVNVLRDAMAVDSLDSCGVYFGTTGGQVYASADAGDNWAPIVRDLPAVLSVEVQTLP